MFGQYGSLVLLVAALAGVAVALPPQKVVKGSPVTAGECPYIVSLRLHGQYICGGSIVSDRHIVTAAHCVVERTKHPYTELVVASGSLSSKSGRTHLVKAVYHHSLYNVRFSSSPYDIGVIVLASPMEFDPNHSILQLPTSIPPSGVIALTAGWGMTSPDAEKTADDLQKINVLTLSPALCQVAMASMSVLYPSQICGWTAPGSGPCPGDSGSPLMYNGQLIGIVSYSGPCAYGFPVVYTSVYHHVDWIKQIMTME